MANYIEAMAGYAAYFPAIPPGAAELALKPVELNSRDFPAGLCADDFNNFDPTSKLVVYNRALMSAGLALGASSNKIPNAMITDRCNRLDGSTVLWDSGGYQLITDKIIWQGDLTRRLILTALEYYADVAVSLDCPPIGISKKYAAYVVGRKTKSQRFPTYEICRDTTVESLKYFTKHRQYGPKPLFLNVLHGENREECNDWYDHVKHFPMEGWAFGGSFYDSLAEILRRIIILRDEHMLDGRHWMHVLGTNRLALTCALTTIQTILSRTLGRFIQISYDTSSPYTMAYGYGMAYMGYSIDKSGLVMKQRRFPNGDYSTDWSQLDFPSYFPTAISNRLKLSDICLKNRSIFAGTSWDTLSYHLIANHNLEVLLNAIIAAHRIYLMDDRNAHGLIPRWLIRTKIGIEEVLTSQFPMDAIAKYEADFNKVYTGGRSMSADDIADDYEFCNRG